MNPLRPRAAPWTGRTAVQRRRLPTFEPRPLRGAGTPLHPAKHNPRLPALLHRGGPIDGESKWEMILGF